MILQVITDTDRRGAQLFAVDLHHALERAGRSVRTVALAHGKVGGLDVAVLGARRLGPATLRALRGELGAAQVAVAHGSTTLPACALATFATSTPFVYRQISDSRFWAPRGLRRLRVRLAIARAARVVALWPGAASVLRTHLAVPPERIRVIPNGVAPERFTPTGHEARATRRAAFGLDRERCTALYAGALVPEKGVDVTIEAVAGVDGLQLLVAGDGPARGPLEALARRLAPGRVVFAGSLEDPVAAYAAADVVVLASRGGDSMPAVLIEAAMMGLPAVATPIGAIPEIVRAGVTGELVAVGSAPELSSALRGIAQAPERAAAMGAAARSHCMAQFAIDVVGAQWAALLDDVANG